MALIDPDETLLLGTDISRVANSKTKVRELIVADFKLWGSAELGQQAFTSSRPSSARLESFQCFSHWSPRAFRREASSWVYKPALQTYYNRTGHNEQTVSKGTTMLRKHEVPRTTIGTDRSVRSEEYYKLRDSITATACGNAYHLLH